MWTYVPRMAETRTRAGVGRLQYLKDSAPTQYRYVLCKGLKKTVVGEYSSCSKIEALRKGKADLIAYMDAMRK